MKRYLGFPSRRAERIRAEVDEELGFHLRSRTEALEAAGLSADEARRQALREFGDLDDARHSLSRMDRQASAAGRRRNFADELRQDAAYALRKLRRSPGFTAVAVATIASGIGANAAIFSVVNSVLFRPLPFPRPGELYQAWSASPTAGMSRAGVSAVDLDDWRAQRRVIADMGGYWYAAGGSGIDLTGEGDPQRLSGVFVTPGFFTTLGVLPALGRLPRDDELVRGGRDRVVVLSHAFWQRQYGGRPDVVGATVTLSGEPFEVLGVMPRSFRFPASEVDIYAPFSLFTDEQIPRIRPVRILEVVARARDGVPRAQVEAELAAITARLARAYPEDASWGAATVLPLHEAVTGSVRRGLLVLLGAVGFVLLIACVNIASLLLARATVRGREIAVRAALGAGRGRLVRQLLTESTVLALVGGAAGVALSVLGVRALVALSAGQLPRGTEVRIDTAVLLFSLALSVLTGLLFGLVPAVRLAADRVHDELRAGGRGMVGGGLRLRNGLVIAEVALAMVLVIGGGLMVRSFRQLLSVDLGFRPENTVVLNFTLSTARHPNYRPIYQQMIEAVRRVPGVVAAGSMKDAPLRGVGERIGFSLPGMVVPPGQDPPSAATLHVSEGFVRALGGRLVAGREFAATDRDSSALVMLVNEAFARQWFPGEAAVGKRVLAGAQVPMEVVGVVHDIRQRSVAEPAVPTIYVHNLQSSRVRMNLIVRTAGDPLALVPALQDAVHSVDRNQPITAVFTLGDAVSDALARPRLLTVLLGAFGALGLVLGALGLYGVLAYLVNQRQRELGVRLALGARRGAVSRMVVRQGLVLAGAGVAIGIAGALALGRLVEGVLFGVTATDPATIAAVTLVLLAVAALASWIPARRAAGLDPVAALRAD